MWVSWTSAGTVRCHALHTLVVDTGVQDSIEKYRQPITHTHLFKLKHFNDSPGGPLQGERRDPCADGTDKWRAARAGMRTLPRKGEMLVEVWNSIYSHAFVSDAHTLSILIIVKPMVFGREKKPITMGSGAYEVRAHCCKRSIGEWSIFQIMPCRRTVPPGRLHELADPSHVHIYLHDGRPRASPTPVGRTSPYTWPPSS